MDKIEKVTACRKELHDLNNKMGAMSGCCSLLLFDDDLTLKDKKYLNIIKEAVNQADLIVKRLYIIVNEIVEN